MQMMTDTTLSQKYQTVIPLLVRKALGLKKGDRVLWQIKKSKDEITAEVKSIPKSWADYSLGLGLKTWKGVDVDKYLNSLRDEWDQ